MKHSSCAHNLPFTIRFMHGQRCLCMSGYAVSSQFVIRELVIAIDREHEHDLSKGVLLRLDLVFTRDYINQRIAKILDETHEPGSSFMDAHCFTLHDEMVLRVRYASCVIAIDWKYKWIDKKVLELFLHRVVLFGVAKEDTLDIAYRLIESICYDFNAYVMESSEVMTFRENCLSIDYFRLMLDEVFVHAGCAMPRVTRGGFKCIAEAGDICFVYRPEEDDVSPTLDHPLPPMIDVFDWMDGELAFVNALNDAFEGEKEETHLPAIARRYPRASEKDCDVPRPLFCQDFDWSSEDSEILSEETLLTCGLDKFSESKDDGFLKNDDEHTVFTPSTRHADEDSQNEAMVSDEQIIGKFSLEDVQSESSLLPMAAYISQEPVRSTKIEADVADGVPVVRNHVSSGIGHGVSVSDNVAHIRSAVSSSVADDSRKKFSKVNVEQELSEISQVLAARDADSAAHIAEEAAEQLISAISKIDFSIEAAAEYSIFFKKNAEGKETWISSSHMAEDFPNVVLLHNMLRAHIPITAHVAVEALLEIRKHFAPPVYVALLYTIHANAPELDDVLKLSALCARSSLKDPLLMEILVDIYTRQGNDTLLLELYHRMYQYYEDCPHKRIAIGINIAHVLAVNMGLCVAAIKHLDGLKPLVMRYGHVDEKIQFAWAYHIGQGTGMAIHYLKQYMKQETQPEDIAKYGYTLASMMMEHNEPSQTVIQTCRSVLDISPHHLPTIQILIRCLEDAKRYEDAAYYAELYLKLREPGLDLCRARQRLVGDQGSVDELKKIRTELIEMVQTLERLYTLLDRDACLCIALRHHLRLEPDSFEVFSQLLAHLESISAYEEMVSISLDFLRDSAEKLSNADELSVRLTLHRICDQRLHLAEEADRHLGRAREIAAMDPRVIFAEIDQCRRRGKTREMIGLRRSLIDVLPPNEAVDQILTLVQNYEDIDEPAHVITELLRKAHRLMPDSVQVLLELRRYLRKDKRYFELASVLEKLIPLTKDLTRRKSLLFEASEAYQHLCNDRRAEELYHEAQHLHPIDPNSNAKFIPPYVPLPTEIRQRQEVAEPYHLFNKDGYSSIETSDDTEVISSESTCLDMEDNEEAQRISRARLSGDTKYLLECLMASQKDLQEDACDPRVLQEIGCIYLYELNDPGKARDWIERAARLSDDVARGEQTVNALEEIYNSLCDYPALAKFYETKCESALRPAERRKACLLLAKVCYEHLGQMERAMDLLEEHLKTSPNHEAALQLIVQVYLDTNQYAKALKHLNAMTQLLVDDPRKQAQHILKMVNLYLETGEQDTAKKLLRDLLNHNEYNEYVDKLSIIEQYKRICRTHDDWEDLLDILQDELCYYLNISRETFSLDNFIHSEVPYIPVGYAIHTFREYADVLYNKFGKFEEAVCLYQLIALVNPKDDYAFNTLCEMMHTHPDNEKTLRAIITVCYPPFSYSVSGERAVPQTLVGKCASEADKHAFLVIASAFEKYQASHVEEANADLERLVNDPKKYIYPEDIMEVIRILKEYWRVTARSGAESDLKG